MQSKITNIRCVLILAALGALAGCASGLSKQECATVDWRVIGYEDGLRGLTQNEVAAHRKACARHGVPLQLDAWRAGWQEGVTRYCRPGNGYRLGRGGQFYRGVCPAALEADFVQAYNQGRELYNAHQAVRQSARLLRQAENHLAALEVDIRDTGLELVAPGMVPARRLVLLDELRKLEAEYRHVRDHEIPELEQQLALDKSRLAQMRAAHAD